MSKRASRREALPTLEVAHRKHMPGRENKSLPQSVGLSSALTGILSLLFRTAEPQSSRNHPLCKKDCVQSRGDEELVRRTLSD